MVSATAAVGGLVALTGSLLSYAVARARGSRREHKLKGDQGQRCFLQAGLAAQLTSTHDASKLRVARQKQALLQMSCLPQHVKLGVDFPC